MKVPKINTTKLEDRSKVVIYLRKEPGTKAHRLHALDTGKLYVSRDVIFEEDKGWKWEAGLVAGMHNSSAFLILNPTSSTTHDGEDVDADLSTPSHTIKQPRE